MNRFALIIIEWNQYNGYVFEFLHLELNRPNIDSALFGVNFSKHFLYIDVFWFTIKVFENYNKEY